MGFPLRLIFMTRVKNKEVQRDKRHEEPRAGRIAGSSGPVPS
jgi:hypothetical protein